MLPVILQLESTTRIKVAITADITPVYVVDINAFHLGYLTYFPGMTDVFCISHYSSGEIIPRDVMIDLFPVNYFDNGLLYDALRQQVPSLQSARQGHTIDKRFQVYQFRMLVAKLFSAKLASRKDATHGFSVKIDSVSMENMQELVNNLPPEAHAAGSKTAKKSTTHEPTKLRHDNVQHLLLHYYINDCSMLRDFLGTFINMHIEVHNRTTHHSDFGEDERTRFVSSIAIVYNCTLGSLEVRFTCHYFIF